jgi:hypothetical protein
VAGNGTAGYSGDGGPATGAELHDPFGVAADGVGGLVIADSENNRIRRPRGSLLCRARLGTFSAAGAMSSGATAGMY